MKKPDTERECKYHGITTYKHNGRGYSCRKCAAESMMRCRRRTMDRLLEDFGSKCSICDYNKCKRALHFHHVDPTTKSFTISAYKQIARYEDMKKEAEKCILVCANCHAEIESGMV